MERSAESGFASAVTFGRGFGFGTLRGTLRLTSCLLTSRSAHHLHPYQSRDQDRQIELSGNSFGDRRVTRLHSYRVISPIADGREGGQAEVDENRENLLLLLGRNLKSIRLCRKTESVGLQVIKQDVKNAPGQSKQQIYRNRHADGFAGDLPLPQHGAQLIPGDESKEQQPGNRTGQVKLRFGEKNMDRRSATIARAPAPTR